VYVPDPPAAFAEMVVGLLTTTGFTDAIGETVRVPDACTVRVNEFVIVAPSESVTSTCTVYGGCESLPVAGVHLNEATFPGGVGVVHPDGSPDQLYVVYVPVPPAALADMVVEELTSTGFTVADGEAESAGLTVSMKEDVTVPPFVSVTITCTE